MIIVIGTIFGAEEKERETHVNKNQEKRRKG